MNCCPADRYAEKCRLEQLKAAQEANVVGWYRKKNGMRRVYLLGFHPLKDFVAVTGGENDVSWLSYQYLMEHYDKE